MMIKVLILSTGVILAGYSGRGRDRTAVLTTAPPEREQPFLSQLWPLVASRNQARPVSILSLSRTLLLKSSQ